MERAWGIVMRVHISRSFGELVLEESDFLLESRLEMPVEILLIQPVREPFLVAVGLKECLLVVMGLEC